MTEDLRQRIAADAAYMRLALRLAVRGRGRTSPNPMVGAVVVQQGRVVGQGYHRRAGAPHAEVVALEQAGGAAAGATLYVTLEPCNHFGRTPPCTAAIIASGISRVVVGCTDPNPRVTGGGIKALRAQGIAVEVGVEEPACRRLNEAFFKQVLTGLPLVVSKVAASLDGKIATRCQDSRWITGVRARRYVHRLRRDLDAVMVGVGTVIADDPRLTPRLVKASKALMPLRVVVDTHLRTPLEREVIRGAREVPTLIATGEEAPAAARRRLEDCGVEVVTLPLRAGRVSLRALLELLGARGINSLLAEGGAQVHGSLLDERLVDKVCVFYAPKLIGGSAAVPMVAGQGVAKVAEAARVLEARWRRFDDDIMLEGYLDYSPVLPLLLGGKPAELVSEENPAGDPGGRRR